MPQLHTLPCALPQGSCQWRPAASTRPGTPRSRSSEQRKALAAVARFNQRLDEMSDTEPSEQEDFDAEDSD